MKASHSHFESKPLQLLASKQKKQDDDLWEVNSDLENWNY